MIVQAIALLDDLDKELNTYAMRVREWYGWHFPEMTKIVTDNIQYAETVRIPTDSVILMCISLLPMSKGTAHAVFMKTCGWVCFSVGV